MNRLISKIELFFSKIEKNTFFNILRTSFMMCSPFLIIGAFTLIITSFPNDSWQTFLETKGAFINNLFTIINKCTIGSLSLIIILLISIQYRRLKDSTNVGVYTLVSVVSYLGYTAPKDGTISMDVFSPNWTFTAILITFLSCLLFEKTIKLLKKKLPYYHRFDSVMLRLSIFTILPILLVICLFTLVGRALCFLASTTNTQNLLVPLLENFFESGNINFGSALLFILLVHLMWIFGIHGNNVLEGVCTNSFKLGVLLNQEAISNGLTPTVIYSKSFMDVFVLMGGSGVCLALIIALVIFTKRRQNKKLAYTSLFPGLFNISEPIVFGLPVIFNPFLIVPFILSPIISLCVAGFCTKIGILPIVSTEIEWTTPIFISGYAATGSIMGPIVQFINLVLCILIYIPFIKMSEKSNELVNEEIKHMTKYILDCEATLTKPRIISNDMFKMKADQILLNDLIDDLKLDKVSLFYQPQVDYNGSVIGVEGLLRWKNDKYGYINPVLVVELAKEVELFDGLTLNLIEHSLKDLQFISTKGINKIKMSVNISAVQLENINFIEKVLELKEKYNIGSNTLALEITERDVLITSKKVLDNINLLNKNDIYLIMDDFGVGYTSIASLKDFQFTFVKIDGSIVKGIKNNHRCKSLIEALCQMSDEFGYQVIAEYVEAEEYVNELHNCGCNIYQGYLYSKALPLNEFIEYYNKNNNFR